MNVEVCVEVESTHFLMESNVNFLIFLITMQKPTENEKTKYNKYQWNCLPIFINIVAITVKIVTATTQKIG